MTIILDNDQVKSLMTYEMAVDAVEHGFRLDAEGKVGPPERVDIPTGSGWLRLMAASADGLGLYGFKAMNLTQERGLRYGLWVYDSENGDLLAILDAQAITATRTACAAAVSTKYLAPDNVSRLAVIGTGAEARTQLLAMMAVTSPQEVTVFSRSEENRRDFVESMSSQVDVPLVACETLDEAVAGAEVIAAATKSSVAVLGSRHIKAGTHVNSVGASRLDQREIDVEAFNCVDVLACDTVAHVAAEAGDVNAGIEAGVIDPADLLSLGEIVVDPTVGRSSPEQVTMYKSVGSAIQDLALAKVIIENAEGAGLGRDLGEFPHLKPFR